MRDYKGWTEKERRASLKKTKAAIAAGIIPPPTRCNRCGKETGRIDYHNHDYSDPIKYLEPLCQGCHTRLHRLENKEIEIKNTGYSPKGSLSNGPDSRPAKKKPVAKKPANVNMALSDWLEKGMHLPLAKLAEHVRSTPEGVKPLKALRGLGIVFCNGYTKEFSSPTYPQMAGKGRDRAKFEVVLERIKYHERNGESLLVKGVPLSEKLESNFQNN